jgi:hypothetical protein
VFLAVRDAAAKILENTTIADIAGTGRGPKGKGRAHTEDRKKKVEA